MADKFSDFVVSIATDPAKMEQYKADPDGVLAIAGLTQEEASLINSGDTDAILARVDSSLLDEGGTLHVMIIRVVRPPPNVVAVQ